MPARQKVQNGLVFSYHPPAKHPLERLLGATCVLQGFAGILNRDLAPTSLLDTAAGWQIALWSTFLLIGGLIYIVAGFLPDHTRAAQFRVGANLFLPLAILLYVVNAYFVLGPSMLHQLPILTSCAYLLGLLSILRADIRDLQRIPDLLIEARESLGASDG